MDSLRTVGLACVGCATESPQFFCPSGTEAKRTRIDVPPIDVVSCRKPDGTLHGPFAKFVEGQLWVAGNHREGRLHGVAFEWLDGGRRGGETEWDAGEMRKSIRWNEAGIATHEMVATGGAEISTLRYESGALKARIAFRGDEAEGPFEAWYESGQKRLRGTYERGRRAGSWTCWDEQGAALHAKYDAAGERVGLEPEAAAAWQGCLRPIGYEPPIDHEAADAPE